nr:macro domain-containing protein [Acutalibacter muris]
MSIKVIDGDLFDTTAPIICHQVNCQGRMGSGIAKIVRSRFPEAFEKYREVCSKGQARLGLTQYVLSKGKVIINMFAQERYGYDGRRYTSYKAFEMCLEDIHRSVPSGSTIAMPYKIGCGLGGGNWDTVYEMIESELGRDYHVELWRLA